jgi:serine/threonine protein kinase
LAAQIDFDDQYWAKISSSGKDLVRKMLDTNPVSRLTADQVLKHPWMIAAEDVIKTEGKAGLIDAQLFLERGFTFTYSKRESKIVLPLQVNGKWFGVDEYNNIVSSTPNVFADV